MSTHRARRVAFHPSVDLPTLKARHERLLAEYDRLAGKLMVSEAEVRRLSKASGRNLSRMIAAQHRAEAAEGALRAAQGTPVQVVRLLLRAETMLYQLCAESCPSCRMVAPAHRYNCRLSRLLTDITDAIPI